MEVFNIISAVASVVTTVIAGMALYSWKKEFIGKKKIELASQIMRAVYDIQDMFIDVRIPIVSKVEIDDVYAWMKSEKEADPDNTDIYPERLKYLVPHQRLIKKQDVIENLRVLQNQAYMYWDKELFTAVLKLTSYNLKILQASKKLYYGQNTPENKVLYDIIFCEEKDGSINPNDKINMEINEIVEEFRCNLEPLYMDKRSRWKTNFSAMDKNR